MVLLAHAAVGDGPAVVLAPSMGMSMQAWGPQVDRLAATHQVVRFDHRGHGVSPVPKGPYEIADLGRDVVEVLDQLELSRVAFVGTSLGGMVGMWLAAHVPDRIDRLVVLCTAAHLPPASTWHSRAARVRAEGLGAVAEDVLARWFTAGFREADPDAVASCAADLLSTPPEGYAAACEAIATMDLRPDLRHITASTLIIAGADDPATTVDDASRIAAAISDARLEIVQAAHLANVEQPDTVTDLILEHLT